MSIRNEAFNWYRRKYGRLDPAIYTSKYYQAYESWPKKSVWWPQVPIKAIEDFNYIHILCEIAPNKNDFYHLKVPTTSLRENLRKFHRLKGQITLYLSTDPRKLIVEQRGQGDLNFKSFLVTDN